MPYLLAGPFVALVGIVAVFFVLRRKSVEKRSMYSARRAQIEHKVRAARQRTLAPRPHADRPAPGEPAAAEPSPFASAQVQPMVTYETPAYEMPPAAPPASPLAQPEGAPPSTPWETGEAAPAAAPGWETGPVAPAAAPGYDYPQGAPEPAYAPPTSEPFQPAPEPTPMAPSEPAWTPAPAPAEPAEPVAPAASSPSSTAAGGWSVVTTSKDATAAEPAGPQKGDKSVQGSSWQLASGEAPNIDGDGEPASKRSGGTVRAIAQYAVLVVGLVMVLIGVLVMIGSSHVT